jgi:nucleoporin NUP159
VSWSTRGKQIAIGTSGGDILQYSPTDPSEAKATIPRANGPDLAGTIPIMIQWLSNYTFYVIYAAPRPEASLDDYQPDQHNYILTYDKKNSHVADTSIPLPWEPYGLSREPGHQIASLRGWGRFKHLVFVNDAHASNVGIIGCIGDASASEEGVWSKISSEDETITFPLTSEMDDTSLVGMDMDLSAETSLLGANQANGDDPTIPPAPILYLLTNDSVVVAFHIVSEDGLPYPGMVRAANSSTDQAMEMSMEKSQRMDMSIVKDQGMEMSMEKIPTAQPAKAAPSAFGTSAPAAPSFGQTGFGFGAAPAPKFGSSGFGSAPGKILQPFALGNVTDWYPAASAFGGFGVSHTTTGPTLGFGAFANSKPAFGQSSFGTPAATPSAASPPSQPTTTSAFGGGFAAFAGPKPAFGQSSFGTPATQSNPPVSETKQGPNPFGSSTPTTSAFGQPTAATPATPTSPNTEPTSGPSSAAQGPGQIPSKDVSVAPTETVFKPASGFGAFSNLNTGGAGGFNFLNPKPVDPQAKPLAFGGFAGVSTPSTITSTAPKFGAPATGPKFGQSGFGQSAFGQTGFGQTAAAPAKSPFATATATATSNSTASSGGGFGAFASAPTSFAALAKVATETKTSAHLGTPPEAPKPPIPRPIKVGPKSFFGSNDAVSQPGFPGTTLRSSTPKEEDDDDTEGKNTTGERFPEEDAEKLEPETTYEGPGLFGPSSGKGKATQGLGGLGFKDEGSSSRAPEAELGKPVAAFGQTIDSSKVAASAAAAFKQPALKHAGDKGGQGSSATATPQAKTPSTPPVSAFGSKAPVGKVTPASSPEKEHKSDDEESQEGSIEVDDDINEFLEGEDFEGVDVVDGEEAEEDEDDGEDDGEEEEEEEDEEEEDEEEGLSDLPEDGEESSEEEPGPRMMKGTQPPPSANKPAPTTPFNPFGRSGSDVAAGTPAKPSAPSLLDRISKPAAPPPSTSAGSPGSSSRPQPIIQPLGTPISSAQHKAKPKPASPKAAFGSWTPPPASKSVTESSKPLRPQTPPGLFGKLTSAAAAATTSNSKSTSGTPSIPSLHTQEKAPTPTPEVQLVQPVYPELQAQLDRVLNEYSAILYHVCARFHILAAS